MRFVFGETPAHLHEHTDDGVGAVKKNEDKLSVLPFDLCCPFEFVKICSRVSGSNSTAKTIHLGAVG